MVNDGESDKIELQIQKFWQQFFQRRPAWRNVDLARALDIRDQGVITRWRDGTFPDPVHFDRLLTRDILSKEEQLTFADIYVQRQRFSVVTLRGITDALMARFALPDPKAFQTYGLSTIRNELDFAKLFRDLCPGEELLWHDTYCPDPGRFMTPLKEAVERGAKLRMLAIDPECENARFRADEIVTTTGFTSKSFVGELRFFLERVEGTLDQIPSVSPGQVQIRLYTDLPSFPMYIGLSKDGTPKRGYSSFFLDKATGLGFPHLEWVDGPSTLLGDMVRYFERKWDDQVSKLHHRGSIAYPR